MTSKPLSTIGFIGTGVMGSSMAGHLLKAGYPLHAYNRTQSKADRLVSQGAIWKDSPANIAKVADIVITIIGFPKDVEAAYLGPDGIIANAKPGGILIEMTTSSPKLALQIAEAASARQLLALDAPVSGGDLGAAAAGGGLARDYRRRRRRDCQSIGLVRAACDV